MSAAEAGQPEVGIHLANEFAAVDLAVDRDQANGPRLRLHSIRDDVTVLLDPHSLALLAHVDDDVLALLADIARDERARIEFREWLENRRTALVLPDDLGERS